MYAVFYQLHWLLCRPGTLCKFVKSGGDNSQVSIENGNNRSVFIN